LPRGCSSPSVQPGSAAMIGVASVHAVADADGKDKKACPGQPQSEGTECLHEDRPSGCGEWTTRWPSHETAAPPACVRHLKARPAPPMLLGGGPEARGEKAGPRDPNKTDKAAPPATPDSVLFQDPRAARIVRETADHYGVEVCLAWAAGTGGTRVAACRGLDTMPALPFGRPLAAGFCLFHHHVDRDLPVVVLDLARDARAAGHPLVEGGPKLRFYAAAPLVRLGGGSGKRYVGTLTIASTRPRDRFTLADGAFLVAQAELLAGILRELEVEAGGSLAPVAED